MKTWISTLFWPWKDDLCHITCSPAASPRLITSSIMHSWLAVFLGRAAECYLERRPRVPHDSLWGLGPLLTAWQGLSMLEILNPIRRTARRGRVGALWLWLWLAPGKKASRHCVGKAGRCADAQKTNTDSQMRDEGSVTSHKVHSWILESHIHGCGPKAWEAQESGWGAWGVVSARPGQGRKGRRNRAMETMRGQHAPGSGKDLTSRE